MADFIDPPFGTIPTSSVASGIFNPGAAISIDLAVRLVNKCVELAQQKDVDFGSKIDAVVAWLEANVPAAITAPTVASPSAITFSEVSTSNITSSPISGGTISATPIEVGTISAGTVSAGNAITFNQLTIDPINIDPSDITNITVGSITAPTPTEPSMTLADTGTALVFNNFSNQVTPIIANALSKFTDFMTAYFPDNDTTYGDAEAYLQSAIENKTQGIVPAEIRAAILLSDRDRLLAEESRAIADLYEAPVVRRHRFPSGAQQAAARRIAQQTLDAIAASSRAVAIKDFELSHQTALESVKMAISARQAALAAATQYIATVIAQSYSTGAGITGTAHSAEVSKIQAAYQAYAERIHAAELALKAVQADEVLHLDAGKANLSGEIELIRANSGLAIDAAKANLGALIDIGKANLAASVDVGKTNAANAIEVSKANVATSLEASKTNLSASIEASKVNLSATLDVEKTNLSTSIDVGKTNLAASIDVSKANLSAALEKGKVNLSASLDASKANLGATLDVSKSNVANTLTADKLNLDAKIRVMDFRVRTLMSEAEIIGHEVTAMLNNLRVGSSMTYGHSVSESLSV